MSALGAAERVATPALIQHSLGLLPRHVVSGRLLQQVGDADGLAHVGEVVQEVVEGGMIDPATN